MSTATMHTSHGPIELELFDGEAEGFINKNPDSPASKKALEAITAFVHASPA